MAGGSRVIAIVDAYDNSTALADLAKYSLQFGDPAVKPAVNFQVIYASGVRPPYTAAGAWRRRRPHADGARAAPGAKISSWKRPQTRSRSLTGRTSRQSRLGRPGGAEATNSWGSDEFASETTSTYTSPFTKTRVVFFASTGDAPPPSYPAVLPNMVAGGGATVLRDAAGVFQGEASWVDAGAGRSTFVSRPSYQAAVQSVVGTKGGIADLAVVANPNTGVWVRSNGAWYVVGGTNVSSPVLAAITNTAGHFLASGTAELSQSTPIWARPPFATSRPAPADQPIAPRGDGLRSLHGSRESPSGGTGSSFHGPARLPVVRRGPQYTSCPPLTGISAPVM